MHQKYIFSRCFWGLKSPLYVVFLTFFIIVLGRIWTHSYLCRKEIYSTVIWVIKSVLHDLPPPRKITVALCKVYCKFKLFKKVETYYLVILQGFYVPSGDVLAGIKQVMPI